MLLCGFPACAFRAADRGCQPAPGLPCALLDKRVERRSKARANPAARLRSCVCNSKCELEECRCRLILRHCERSDLSAEALAKAEAIQKCIRGKCLDRFVARAPRNDDVEAVSLDYARLPVSPSRRCRH